MVNILVIGDLHGAKPIIHFKDFDCIVQVGDFCSDKILRAVYKKWFKYLKKVGRENVDISFDDFVVSILGNSGLKKAEEEQLKEGRKVLEYLDSFDKPVFVIPGNWDKSFGKTRIKDTEKSDYNYDRALVDEFFGKRINSFLTKGLKNIKDCQFALHEFRGINFIGYGNSSGPEKFKEKLKKRDYSKSEKSKLKVRINEFYSSLEELFRKGKKNPIIFISHNVPFGILDKCNDRESYVYGKHLGSTVARDMICKFEPLLCLAGHMHEYHGKKKLGKTIVVNAGFGRKVNTLIEINDKSGKVRSVKFWDGKK